MTDESAAKIVLIDQAVEIGAQPQHQDGSEQRVGVARLGAEHAGGNAIGLRQIRIESPPDSRVGIQFLGMAEVVVVHKEFRLQNVQTVEFGEQISRGIRSRGERIIRMRLRVVGESLVRRRELQIVHLQVAQVEPGGGAS